MRAKTIVACVLSGASACMGLLAAAPLPSSKAGSPAVTLPDTRPGQLLGAWLRLCQTPSLAALTNWNQESMAEHILKEQPAEALARDDLRQCVGSGGVRLLAVHESTPTAIKVLGSASKTGVHFDITMRVDPQGKLTSGGLEPTLPPESALPARLTDDALAAEISSLVDKLAAAGQFSGIVMVARDAQPIVTKAAGLADRARRAPITPASQFTLASMGKMFTAAAVGQLVDQGKISYADAVGKFFPAYQNKTVREKVTVGMLLSHTGGLGNFLDRRTPAMMKSGVKRAAELIPLFEKDEPRFAPGTSWGYSNAGLALAGAIVEKAAGEAYPDYLRKHLFAPAGMKDSDPNNVPHRDPRMVTPYTLQGEHGPLEDWREAESDLGSPAGGALSTAPDLVRFADALRSGRLVSAATFAEMARPHGQRPGGGTYGYGMGITQVLGRTIVEHGGGYPGVSTRLSMLLGTPYTVVVLANLDPPAAEVVALRALALVVIRARQAGPAK